MAFDLTARMNLAAPSTRQVDRALDSVNKSLDKGTKKAQTFSDVISLKTTNFAAYTVASAAVLKLTSSISNAVTQAIKLEKELVKVSQIVGISVNGARKLSAEVLNISTSYGVSATKVAETIKTLTQSGLSFDKARKAAELLAKTTLLSTFDSLSSTTEGLVAIFAQFNLSVKQAEVSLGAINALSKRYAVESSDLIDAVKRAGGVFASTGGSLEDLLAIITTVRSTTRESSETIATGVRTIFTRLQRPRTIQYLKQLNIELADAQGNFIGNKQALDAISAGLERLGIRAGSVKFAEVAQEIAGVRQQSRLIPLLTQQAKLAEITSVANAGLVETDEDVAKAKQTLAFRIDQLRAKFEALVAEISQSTSFKLLTTTLLNLADSFLSVASALKPLIPILTAFATIKIANTVGKTIRSFRGASNTGSILGFNRGGYVPGSGSGDTVPAMLEPGEFVIRKSAAQALGAEELNKINKYNTGGEATATLRDRKEQIAKKQSFDPYSSSAKIKSGKLKNLSERYQVSGSKLTKLAEQKKMNPAAIGGLRGIIFETAVQDRLGVNISTGFPDVGKKDLSKIGSGFSEYDSAELKYANNSNTRSEYYESFFGSGSVGKKIPMIYGYNSGGFVPGSGNGDTIPAMLTPGEFVINRKSAEAFGYGQLAKVNKYATGGIVGRQKFSTGGGVGGATISENINEDLSRGLGNIVNTLSEANQIFDETVNNLGYVGEQIRSTTTLTSESRGNIAGSFNTRTKNLSVNTDIATASTVLHETGHAADNVLGGGGAGERASTQEGTFQNELAKLAKDKIRMQLEELKAAGKISEKELEYRLRNQEIFADLFATSSPAVQKIITSTTDAAKGMEALKQAITDQDVGRLYGDIDQDLRASTAATQKPQTITNKSTKSEIEIGGQGTLTKEIAVLVKEIKAETAIVRELEKRQSSLQNSIAIIDDQVKKGIPNQKARIRAAEIRLKKQAELAKVEDDLLTSMVSLEGNIEKRDAKISKAKEIKTKSTESLQSGSKETAIEQCLGGTRSNKRPSGLPLPAKAKPEEPVIFLPKIKPEDVIPVDRIVPKFEKAASGIEALFESSAVLALGFSVFTKNLTGANSELGNFLDKLSGELVKNQIIATAAGETGSGIGTGLLSGVQKLFGKDEDGKRKITREEIATAGFNAANALATVAIQAAILYKSFKDAALAVEIETQERLKKTAIEKGNVVAAEKAAAAGSDASNQKVSGDLAAGALGGLGGLLGTVLGSLTALFPPLTALSPVIASIGGKIGTAIGTFLSTFKVFQNFIVRTADGIISAVNAAITFFGGDPIPTITETFEKNKRLAIERARSEALFNKAVLNFDSAQKNFSSKISQSNAINGVGSDKSRNLITSQLEGASLSTADFASQLENEKVKPQEEQDEELIKTLEEKIKSTSDQVGESTKALAISLREGGASLSDSLAKIGAKLDEEGNVIGIADNSALAAYRDALAASTGNMEAATEETKNYAAQIIAATVPIKASQEAFDELAKFKLDGVSSGLEVAGIRSETRSNKNNLTQTAEQARFETSEIISAAKELGVFSNRVNSTNRIVNQLSASTKAEAEASKAVAEAKGFETQEQLKTLAAAKIARQSEVQIIKEIISAKKGELEASKRAAGELLSLADLEVFGTKEEKQRNEEGIRLVNEATAGLSTDASGQLTKEGQQELRKRFETLNEEEKQLFRERINRTKNLRSGTTSRLTGQDIETDLFQAANAGARLSDTGSTAAQDKVASEIEKYQLALQDSERAIVDQDFQNRMIANAAFKSAVDLFAGKVDENINGSSDAKAIPIKNPNNPEASKIREEIAAQNKAIAEADRIIAKAKEKPKVVEESETEKKVKNAFRLFTGFGSVSSGAETVGSLTKSESAVSPQNEQQIRFAEGLKKRATERKNTLQQALDRGAKSTPDQIVNNESARQAALKYTNKNSLNDTGIDTSDKRASTGIKVTHDHKFGPIELKNIPQQGTGDAMVELANRISDAGRKQKQAEEMGSPDPASSFDELLKF